MNVGKHRKALIRTLAAAVCIAALTCAVFAETASPSASPTAVQSAAAQSAVPAGQTGDAGTDISVQNGYNTPGLIAMIAAMALICYIAIKFLTGRKIREKRKE